MKIKRKSALIMALVVMVGTTAAYVSRTYAKYTAAVSATGEATIARWNFDVDNANQNLSIDISTTPAVSGTLEDNMIAPGTEGEFAVNLSNANSDVGVFVTMRFDTTNTDIPTNMVLSQNSTALNLNNNYLTCYVPAGGSQLVTFGWEWPYETGADSSAVSNVGDPADVLNGQAVSSNASYINQTATVAFNITGVQVNPSSDTGIVYNAVSIETNA